MNDFLSPGKALRYTDLQWPRLTTFAEDGHLRMDNILVKNAIPTCVIGPENSLLVDSVTGTKAGEMFTPLIETLFDRIYRFRLSIEP